LIKWNQRFENRLCSRPHGTENWDVSSCHIYLAEPLVPSWLRTNAWWWAESSVPLIGPASLLTCWLPDRRAGLIIRHSHEVIRVKSYLTCFSLRQY